MKKGHREYKRAYEKQADYYDVIYEAQGKDYKKEAEQIRDVIESNKKSSGNTLLDVGCGTGAHFPYLREWYSVEGLDVDGNMLKVARQRHPDTVFYQEDMVKFDIGKKFDAVTCLFSAIGYAMTVPNLQSAIKSIARHTKTGGVIVVEPWFSPEQWSVGRPSAVFVNKPEMKIARMNVSERRGNVSIVNFHFLVATPGHIEHFTEMHEIGLFTKEEYMEAFEKAGLNAIHYPEGITGRGLYIAVKS